MFLSLTSIELSGFKSFGRKTELKFRSPISAIVGPNGSGKSNIAEAFRFVLGEQSMKSMRSKRGEDLIWGGSPALPRSSRASAKVVFDNSQRLLDIDFKEVVIERIVFRDGQNEYLLNGTQVRLRDVIRLLAGANIGGSGYQIISQGEADRILNASPRERREMVEDALGLKLYQHKKAESERKLEETSANIEKTKSLRREIAPHLHFLRVQVEKIEKARERKEELAVQLIEYLAREHAWITQEEARLRQEKIDNQVALQQFSDEISRVRARLASEDRVSREQLRTVEKEIERRLTETRKRREEVARELGRAEGALKATNVTVEAIVPIPHVRQFVRDLDEALQSGEHHDDVASLHSLITDIRGRIKAFIEGLSSFAPLTNEEVRRDVERLSLLLMDVEQEEMKLAADGEAVRAKLMQGREADFVAERRALELDSSIRDARMRIEAVDAALSQLARERQRFEEEVREALALGVPVRGWESDTLPSRALIEDRAVQEKRRRAIERLKIKIEESGIGNSEAVVREFTQIKERDEFLSRELADLERSAASLKSIIAELEETIDRRFADGLKLINEALKDFFMRLFGGGYARLSIESSRQVVRYNANEEQTDDDENEDDLYTGLSIDVSLPRKKIRGLESLSGGERALTSIALIFSMTQVNPPPFLILDETDAALDEANSRRYANMIKELSKKSQLIVITHNRATMAVAGELYGITMGHDGVSRLLSVRLEEAEQVAK